MTPEADNADFPQANLSGTADGRTCPQGYGQEAIELSLEALKQVRVTLMMSFRFLDAALWRMPLKPAPIVRTLATDGITLWFDPISVLRSFRTGINILARDMLHCLLHCILRNPFDLKHEDTRAWWLACDIAVEEMARELAGDVFPVERDLYIAEAAAKLKSAGEALTPHKLYGALDMQVQALSTQGPEAGKQLEDLEQLFMRDSHMFWQTAPLGNKNDEAGRKNDKDLSRDNMRSQASSSNEGSGQSGEDEATPENQAPEANDPLQDSSSPSPSENGSSDSQNLADAVQQALDEAEAAELEEGLEAAEQEWEEISKRMQEDLETYSRKIGATAGGLMANITVANRKPMDYADFLRKFASRREDTHINDDEFDYIFYTYGLDTYGDMPLIEPLEYQEIERVREFVIAIDTSGSCAGDLVRAFIERTFQILRQTEQWGDNVNVHIIQCDATVHEDLKITSMEELGRVTEKFQVKGFGGTDFRPVFHHVNRMIEDGEFNDLRGIIYFTDGYGTFPTKPPDYDAAFVFIEDEGEPRNVPPWAIKVVLRNDELKVL